MTELLAKMPYSYTVFLLFVKAFCVAFEISISLWIAFWWHFEDLYFWNPLTALLAIILLDYPVFTNDFSTLILFSIPWSLAFLQMTQSTWSSSLSYTESFKGFRLKPYGFYLVILPLGIRWALISIILNL